MVAFNPPVLPAFLPLLPTRKHLRSLTFASGLGVWEDFLYYPARTPMRRARVRIYASILPYSQRDKGNKGFRGLGAVVVWEGGLNTGRIA
jgi:hypothetical protein